MTAAPHDRVVAVATVATDGEVKILDHSPLTAAIGPGGRIMMQLFEFEPASTIVVELFIPVARVRCNAELDRWLARMSLELFNVHVAARDVEDATFVEARSSLLADGLTVQTFQRAL